jgi:hypothetical protein
MMAHTSKCVPVHGEIQTLLLPVPGEARSIAGGTVESLGSLPASEALIVSMRDSGTGYAQVYYDLMSSQPGAVPDITVGLSRNTRLMLSRDAVDVVVWMFQTAEGCSVWREQVAGYRNDSERDL